MAASASETAIAGRERIWQVVHAIPPGRVASYGQVAALAGLPRAARLVGRVLSQLPEGSTLPWHRVINSRGCSSFPEGSPSYREQRQRLLEEGVVFERGRVARRYFAWE
jgi:methylated-DNA-protein-cysteine methyltransferase-like protein